MIEEKAIKRFWSKVKKGENENDCWEWQAHLSKKGYGRFRYKGKYIGSHRVAWMIEYGDIPEGMCCCHKCDNTRCVRSSHIFLGSNADNNQDMMKKGRYVSGMKGKHHTDYQKQMIGLRNRGNKYALGVKRSEETRNRMSKSLTGRKLSQITKDKIRLKSLGNKKRLGKKQPLEAIEKSRIAHLKENRKKINLNCKKCSKDFIGPKGQIFCCIKCSNKYHNDKNNKRHYEERRLKKLNISQALQ